MENGEPKMKKTGFFGLLFGVGSELSDDKSKNKKSGRCCGNCAKCPPHYGYRYGRWYYGHGHVRGCEFGGNGNDKCKID